MNFIRKKSIIIAGLILIILFTATGYCIEGTENQIKSAMMINFIKFVEWPEQLNKKIGDTITVGILGSENFINTLKQIEGRSIGGKQLSFRNFNSANHFTDCQVLYIGAGKSDRCYQILREVIGTPILTIGEDENFIRMGGIIRFYTDKNHIRFEINQVAAQKSDLKLSAKLLEVAAAIQ